MYRAAFMDMIDEWLERLELAFATDEDVHARSLPPSPQGCRAGAWLGRSVGPSRVHRISWTTS
jgi:hypothetical protein